MKTVKKYYRTCQECGRRNERVKFCKDFNKILCDSCIKTFKNHPVKMEPNKMKCGEIYYDNEQNIICHLCGRSYKNLTKHIKQKHKITADEYKERFKLNRTQSLVGIATKKLYSQNANIENLNNSRTVFKKGHTNSKKERRLQYIKNRTGVKYNKRINNKGE